MPICPLLWKKARKKAPSRSCKKCGCTAIMNVSRVFLTTSRRRSFEHIHIVTAKRRRYAIIDNRKKDEWSGFADLLANLIEKYAAVLDIENLPEPPICLDSEKKEIVNNSKLFAESIEKEDIA